MQVVPYGPFRVGSVLWQPRPGAWAFTVICKATFELTPGESPLIVPPKGALEAEPQAPGDQRRLLDLAIDHAPLKRSPEVIVVGHAYAPEGALVTSLVARLAVGEVDKVVQVFGDRSFTREGVLTGPARFTKMPLAWECAAGGPGTSNPVGVRMGAEARADGWGRIALPNFQPAGQSIAMPEDVIPPIGLGPIAPSWPGRMARLHRHAATWDPTRWNERPLPDDVDFAYFNAAPRDQALKELTGSERVLLENLHPRFARLATYLRVVAPRATATLEGGAPREVHLRCDTLVIDTDRGTAMLVWRGNVPLDHPDREGIVLVSDGRSAEQSAVETVLASAQLRPVMPFREAGREGAPSGAAAPSGLDLPDEEATWRLPPPRAVPDDGTGTVVGALVGVGAGPVLPFGERAAPAEAAQVPPPVWQPRVAEPGWEARSAEPARKEPEAPSALRGAPVEPPPMLGPLATPAMVTAAALPEEKTSAPEVEAARSPAKAPEVEAPLPLEMYPLERCARIAAQIACRPKEKSAILEAQELSLERWAALHEHWMGRIREEAARSRTKLLFAYDAMYVGELEAEGGAIGVEEYARFAEAAERSAVSEALAGRGLPEETWGHIHRVWIGRMVKDVRIGKQVRGALEGVRGNG